MDRILELRAKIADGTITKAEIAELRELVATESAALANDLTDEAIATIEELAQALDDAATIEAAIDAEQAEREGRAAAAMERIRQATTPADDTDDGGEPTVVAETPADEPVVPEAEPVAASAPTPAVPKVTRVSSVAAGRSLAAAAPAPKPQMALVAAANVPGVNAGESLMDPERFAHAFAMGVQASAGYRGATQNIPIATAKIDYPDAEYLDGDMRRNASKINARTSLAAMKAYADSHPDLVRRGLVASGGACAPSTVLYDLPVLGGAERPVRDNMLVRFGADRGGVRIMPSPTIGDVTSGTGASGSTAAITTWTAATDASPGTSAKSCMSVSCPSPTETLVDAIVRCLKFGNFQARFFAEQVDAWLTVAAAAWARVAETKMLTAIGAGSTNFSVGQGLGTTRDVLATLDRACASLRNYHRLPANYPLTFAFPEWLMDNMRTDLAREIPGSSQERLATSDAELMAMFAVRNVNVAPFKDGETGQVFARQGAGALLGWPSTVVTYLYPSGSWLFLDGGTLDLGVVRDSTLNAKNDFQMFAESFEAVAFHGVVSYRMTLDICPSGQTSAAQTFNPCTVGS